jgi:hypothetical protein
MVIDQQFEKAKFTYRDAGGQQKGVAVNFNPATLEHSITAQTQGEGGQAAQVVGTASAKVTMELLFDTTDTGEDVRTRTHEFELMLKPAPGAGGDHAPPQVAPSVTFEWGAFHFTGVVDSFKQTIDFFSANGVPLRASLSLSLSQPDYQFDQQGSGRRAEVAGDLVVPGGDPSSLAAAGGDPSAARGIAAANGLESLRASAAGGISLGGGVSIGAAAGFSAGAGAGAGAGFGGGAGAGLGASASLGVGLSAGIGVSAGGAASAGVAASAGAFSGLHTEAAAGAGAGKYFNPQKVFAEVSSPAVAPGAAFDVTGKAVAQAASGFKAEVGAPGRILFDE